MVSLICGTAIVNDEHAIGCVCWEGSSTTDSHIYNLILRIGSAADNIDQEPLFPLSPRKAGFAPGFFYCAQRCKKYIWCKMSSYEKGPLAAPTPFPPFLLLLRCVDDHRPKAKVLWVLEPSVKHPESLNSLWQMVFLQASGLWTTGFWVLDCCC